MSTAPPARLGADRPAPLGSRCPECAGDSEFGRGGPWLLHVISSLMEGEYGYCSGSGLNLVCPGRVGRFGFRDLGLGLGLDITLPWLYSLRARWHSPKEVVWRTVRPPF